MSLEVWLLPTHPGEPAWSAINRVHGPGADRWLDDDDPAARRTLHDAPPRGWRAAFEAQLRPLASWEEDSEGASASLWASCWRWSVHLDERAVELCYRKTGPSRDGDLDDREVMEIARRLGMLVWWTPSEWVDLRSEEPPDSFG